jgi:hypothetical protein
VSVVPILTQSAPVDPDWLLSSTVQSAAVLVAIVGGFLVSRLVTLSAERGAIIQRRQQRNQLRQIKQAEYDEVHADRLALSSEWFVNHHQDQLLEARGSADVESLLEEFIPRGSSYQEMRQVAENLINSMQAAFRDIESKFPSGIPPRASSELRESGVTVPEGSEDIYESVASHIADERKPSRPRNIWESPAFTMPSKITPAIVYQRQDARIDLEMERNSELRALNSELALLDEELSTFKKPEGIKGAIAVLIYLTLVGIALPTILMALRPVPDGPLSRAAIVAAFISGLIVLLVYLLFRVRSLRPPRH